MRRGRLAASIALGLAAAPAATSAFAQPPGFSFCAPPTRPACVESAPPADAACDREVQTFVAATIKYRECLNQENDRAVRDANDAIQAWRCRADKKKCRR